jgi:hypothetical protein
MQSDMGRPLNENFWRWFGSSVMTVGGEPFHPPMTMYHGTQADFTRFLKRAVGSGAGAGIVDTDQNVVGGAAAGPPTRGSHPLQLSDPGAGR